MKNICKNKTKERKNKKKTKTKEQKNQKLQPKEKI